jgi:pyridoxal phosphate enzyme (YggS family)
MSEVALAERLTQVYERIGRHREVGGWSHLPRIVAVTKNHGWEAVAAAVAAGIDAVGENRVQEALSKQADCPQLDVAWHLIGNLQKNKVRQIVGRFELIHSVDRLDLALELDRRSDPLLPQGVLVQVNCSGEPQKFGVAPDALPELLDQLRACPLLKLRGLMTMAAYGAEAPELHRTFGQLRELRTRCQAHGHDTLVELSMGMSDDYGIAVEHGATLLRLGTVLFGSRS